MRWTTRRDRDHCRYEGILGGREIGSPTGSEIVRLHLGDEIVEPIGVGDAVAVGVGDNLPGSRLCTDIAGDTQPLVRLTDDPAKAVAFSDFKGTVARAVIDDNNLIIWIVEGRERGQTAIDCALRIVSADHDGDPGVAL